MTDPKDPFAGCGADHALIRRRDAAQATLDQWRVAPFRFGHADCVRMVASHLRRMGYRIRLPHAGAYRTANSALRALKVAGYDSLAAALDALGLARIAPAAALPGDIIQMPSEIEQIGALTVAMGNGRVVGWWGDGAAGAVVMQPTDFVAAWRVEPKA